MRYLLLLAAALLSSCAGERIEATLSQPLDTTVQHQVQRQVATSQLAELLRNGSVKFKGPVTFQIGGTNNSASSTDASKAKAPVAAAPHAVATDASTRAGTPWSVYLGLVLGSALVGVFVGAYLRGKFSLLSFLA